MLTAQANLKYFFFNLSSSYISGAMIFSNEPTVRYDFNDLVVDI